MPRFARLELAGLLQHLMVRGIERRDMFFDDHDRQRVVDRFASLLSQTGVRCYAWKGAVGSEKIKELKIFNQEI